jgi:hypothetical protein
MRSLRLSLRHAESLAAFILSLEQIPRWAHAPPRQERDPRATAARAWLIGRAREIRCFVRDVARDADSKSGEGSAAAAIDDYLVELHKGLARHFGERFPSCCAASSTAITATPTVPNEQVTRKLAAKSGVVRRAPGTDIPADDLLGGFITRAGG